MTPMRLALAGAIVVALRGAAPAQSPQGIERVAWLQGCWEWVTPAQVVDEHWMAPRGDTMLGVGRTVRGGRLTTYELVVIRQAEGSILYEAHPAEQSPAVFRTLTLGDREIVFENPQHDFPQRVGYRLTSASTLLAWIEGTETGKTRRIEFPYTRSACDR